MTLKAVSLEDSILPVPLRFPPPYADLSTNPEGFAYNWQLLEYAFHPPKPSAFPPFERAFESADLATVRRYVETCRRLAGYSFVSSTESMTVNTENGKTTVETNFASFESLSAHAVLFRQVHEHKEHASFRNVHSILSRYARMLPQDVDDDLRQDHLRHWRKAVGALMSRMLKPYVGRLVADASHPSGISVIPAPHEDLKPLEVMSRWNYGELIHWGDKRSDLEAALGRDEVWTALERMHVGESMIGLSHLYFGFSQVVERAIERQAN